MKVYTNEQARNYLDSVASGRPVKPDVSGFFYSDIEQGWLTFKAGPILEFWIEPTQQAALNRLMKVAVLILAFTALIGCADKTRYCECKTQYTHRGEIYQEEINITEYTGSTEQCENILIVNNQFGEVRIECKEVTP